MEKYSIKFIIGIILLCTNQPVGWGALVFSTYMFKKTKKKIFPFVGAVIYAISWGMLGLGIILAGPDGKKIVEQFLKTHRLESVILIFITILIIFIYLWMKKRRKAAIANNAENKS